MFQLLWAGLTGFFNELMPSMMKEHGEMMPAFDISEADDHFVVKADLPGIDPKNLDISLTGNVLTIRGEKKEEREEKNERYYTLERQFGSFTRSFMLPADVKEDGIEASYKGGVLRVNIPKSERAKQKKIPVKMN
ncbi:MAG: Hsp20/alpha crystallin family protein [Syntrophobacteraceae bacterium]|jgi:HSP20 family protein